MTNFNRWEPFRSAPTLHQQLNRMFGEGCNRQEESNLTTWAPAVDILETEQELVVKADLTDIDPKQLDIRVENNILTIRGERKFEKASKREELPAGRTLLRAFRAQLLAG